MQKEPKDKDSEFESLVYWVLLHNFVNEALGENVDCMKSHCDLRSVICVKETSSQDKEARIKVFQTHSQNKASYDKTFQGRKKILPPNYSILP